MLSHYSTIQDHPTPARPAPNAQPQRTTHPTAQVPQLSVGGAGAGAAMHYHSAAWNALLFGRKQW
jgi:hypothetical protein